MSEVSEQAILHVELADYAANDPTGKLNMIGGGVRSVGYEPQQGITNRFSVVGTVTIPSELCPADLVVEFSLLHASGELVTLPNVTGGAPQNLRVGQAARVEKPSNPMIPSFPPEIPGVYTMVLDFSTGLPLAPGQVYAWQLRVDGDAQRTFTYHFFVPSGPTPPVLG